MRTSRQFNTESSVHPEVTHRHVKTNGISMHIAEAGSGPRVLLVHGFPELWYSWRHQLPVLAEAGFHAVAPDLRGYGGTDVSTDDAMYTLYNLSADLIVTAVGSIARRGVRRAKCSPPGVRLTN